MIAVEALVSTGMDGYAGRDFNGLSGGERQLVLIARALAGKNQALLLDEPASALDLKNQDIVLGLMQDIAAEHNLAVAFTTHQPNHALAIADHVLMMPDETETILGPIEDVMTDANLQTLYGIPVRSVAFVHDGVERSSIAPVFRNYKQRPLTRSNDEGLWHTDTSRRSGCRQPSQRILQHHRDI